MQETSTNIIAGLQGEMKKRSKDHYRTNLIKILRIVTLFLQQWAADIHMSNVSRSEMLILYFVFVGVKGGAVTDC